MIVRVSVVLRRTVVGGTVHYIMNVISKAGADVVRTISS